VDAFYHPCDRRRKRGRRSSLTFTGFTLAKREREREEGGREAGARQFSYRPVYHVSFTHPQPNTSTPFPYTT